MKKRRTNGFYTETDDFDTHMSFGAYLRKKRRLMKFSQLEFADKLGIDPNTVSRWELEKSAPPIDLAKDIITSLGGELQIVESKE